jgi:hypothetical protein
MFGNYDIRFRSPNGCELFKTFVLQEGSACETSSVSPHGLEAVAFYPNPVTHQLTITHSLGQLLKLQIVDLSGSVKDEQVSVGPGEQMVDLNHLPEGLYVFTLSDVLGNHIASRIIEKVE